jgi:predicted PurR-regulated permease PerM
MVDKFIRPRLIGRRVSLPFQAVLSGLLGGVSTMGVPGLPS